MIDKGHEYTGNWNWVIGIFEIEELDACCIGAEVLDVESRIISFLKCTGEEHDKICKTKDEMMTLLKITDARIIEPSDVFPPLLRGSVSDDFYISTHGLWYDAYATWSD